jgi:hypothetical protein
MGKCQNPQSVRHWHRRERRRAAEVGPDHDQTPPGAVDPDARRNSQREIRQGIGRREQRDLIGPGVEREECRQRQRQQGDLAAERADRLRAPEAAKVSVSPKRAETPCRPTRMGDLA